MKGRRRRGSHRWRRRRGGRRSPSRRCGRRRRRGRGCATRSREHVGCHGGTMPRPTRARPSMPGAPAPPPSPWLCLATAALLRGSEGRTESGMQRRLGRAGRGWVGLLSKKKILFTSLISRDVNATIFSIVFKFDPVWNLSITDTERASRPLVSFNIFINNTIKGLTCLHKIMNKCLI